MNKFFEYFEKYLPIIKVILFTIACIFVYAGTVNYGGFDILPAIPFIIFMIFAAVKWKNLYLNVTVSLFVVFGLLYFLKTEHGRLFHPALGKEFYFIEDMCLEQTGKVVFARLSSEVNTCMPDAFVSSNTKFRISRISVSNADMGESYLIHAQTPLGELYLFENNDKYAVWADGKPVQQSDLRRAIFYKPSQLMYWPMAPSILKNRLANGRK